MAEEAREHQSANPDVVFSTDLSLPGARRGKVRDIYNLSDDRLLIVASDRISAFDVVMPTPIGGKGRLLTEIAAFWLRFVEARRLCPTHLISTDDPPVPASAFTGKTTAAHLRGRSMVARRCRVIPVECVVRGYLEGSGWKEYQQFGSVCEIPLPSGLRQCDRLPEPIFTPATKEQEGAHDQNISFDRAARLVGGELMEKLRDLSISIYKAAAEYARARGIIIADTKFEFGLPTGGGESGVGVQPILIDEALTPDSSRFWPVETYQPGRAQASFDKQFLREYLETLVAAGTWDKRAPGPRLPDEVVAGTLGRYQKARDCLITTRP